MNERLDDLHIKNFKILQNPDFFCFGTDAVLLSDFARAHRSEAVLDLCCGGGILPLLLAAKTAAEKIRGLEIQPPLVDLARRNVALNGQENRIEIVEGDVCYAADYFPGERFDVVTCNPPYQAAGSGLTSEDMPQLIARHEVLCTFPDVARAVGKLLRPGGRFYLVHRPHRLCDLIPALRENGVEPKRLRFVHPKANKRPTMVLLEGRRCGGVELLVEPPLILYDEQGRETAELRAIYNREEDKPHDH